MSKNVRINIYDAGVNKKVNFEHIKEILRIFKKRWENKSIHKNRRTATTYINYIFIMEKW